MHRDHHHCRQDRQSQAIAQCFRRAEHRARPSLLTFAFRNRPGFRPDAYLCNDQGSAGCDPHRHRFQVDRSGSIYGHRHGTIHRHRQRHSGNVRHAEGDNNRQLADNCTCPGPGRCDCIKSLTAISSSRGTRFPTRIRITYSALQIPLPQTSRRSAAHRIRCLAIPSRQAITTIMW